MIIYKATNTSTGKMYVGQTKNSLNERWIQHCSKSKYGSKNNKFHNAIKKYGKSSFILDILEEVTVESSNDRETYWINYFDTMNNGYNSRASGQDCCLTEEVKIKISNSLKGRKVAPFTEEHRKNLSKANKGNNNWLGKHHKNETKDKCRLSKLGERNPNYGKRPSQESIDKRLATIKRNKLQRLLNSEHLSVV